MRLNSSAILCGAVAAVIVGGALHANATEIGAFVVTSQEAEGNNPMANTFQYVGQNPATEQNPAFFFTTLHSGSPVTVEFLDGEFHYDITNGTGLVNVNIPAEMELTASAVVPTDVATTPGGTFFSQQLVNVVMTVTATTDDLAHGITGNESGPGTGSNLLSAGGTGTISGFQLDITGASTGSQLAGDTVAFTSDFLDTATLTNQTWNIELNNITQPLNTSTPPLVQPTFTNVFDVPDPSQFLNSFTASGSPSFSATLPGVPEPASIGLLGVGAAGLMIRKKRNTR